MSAINHFHQRISGFAKRQIKIKYHFVNMYGYKRASLLTGIEH